MIKIQVKKKDSSADLMLVVGLTGGIASGKSTVSAQLHDKYNFPIIDADKIAREIVEPGKPAYQSIVKYFEKKITGLLKEDGTLNRPALGRYVFSNKSELQILNSITHPEVRKEILRRILKCWLHFEQICILDVPLLFEAGMDKICGKTICVICNEEIQLQRLMKRNSELTKEDCINRIHNQLSNKEQSSKADIVIENDGTLEGLYIELDKDIKGITPCKALTYLEVLCPPFAVASALFYITRKFVLNFAERYSCSFWGIKPIGKTA